MSPTANRTIRAMISTRSFSVANRTTAARIMARVIAISMVKDFFFLFYCFLG